MLTQSLNVMSYNRHNPHMAEEEKNPEDILGKPMQEYRIEVDEVGAGVERFYFWFTQYLQSGPPSGVFCKKIWKIRDIYSATETSSYFGSVEQRKGLQQDRVSQYLATIGKMIKDLFQIVRELRIMDERYEYYEATHLDKNGNRKEGADDAEVALKSIWIDMVEGGAKNPTSVLGLASQVGFTILPDLFFTIHPTSREKVNAEMAKLGEQGINRKIQEVLGRKLWQYMDWKEKTDREITQRKNFMLKYLRQHYNTINMYIGWVRPYLQNLKRLQMKQNPEDVDLISAFETSKIELELFGRWDKTDEKKQLWDYQPFIRIRLTYVTIPQMAYQQEYQRGAIHTGRTIIQMSNYVMKKDKLDEYKKALEEEDLELISGVIGAMDALKDELKKYLKEAGEKFKEDEKKEEQESNLKLYNPFTGALDGFKELFGIKLKQKEPGKKYKSWETEDQKSACKKEAQGSTYRVYDVFKKAHKLVTW